MKPKRPDRSRPKMTKRRAVFFAAAAAAGIGSADQAVCGAPDTNKPQVKDAVALADDSGDTDSPRRRYTRMGGAFDTQDTGIPEDSAEALNLEGVEAERAAEHYDFKQQAMTDIVASVTEPVQVGWSRTENQEDYDEFLTVSAVFGYPLGEIYPDEHEATLTFIPGDKLQEFCEAELGFTIPIITVEESAQMAGVIDQMVRLDGYANEYDMRMDQNESEGEVSGAADDNAQAILNRAREAVGGIDNIPSV